MKVIHLFTFAFIFLYTCPFTLSHNNKNGIFKMAETMCAIMCHIDGNCIRYLYTGSKHRSHGLNGSESFEDVSCIFVNKGELAPTIEHIPNMFLKTITTTNNVIHTSDQRNHLTIKNKALEAGFNLSITIGSDSVFFKEVRSNDTYDDAMLKCLAWGGILPMEETNEFVDQMSILSNDRSSPRFISIAEEYLSNGPKSLVWTCGKIVWTEGEDVSKCPKCQNWIFSNAARQVATINPTNKMYESIALGERISKYFCQYLGVNLATGKRVLVSSTLWYRYRSSLAVDGNPFQDQNFWHSGSKMSNGEWISVDLGKEFWIYSALFLGRMYNSWHKNQMVHVWIGGPEPREGIELDTSERTLCGVYPFQQHPSQLNGVTCPKLILGQYVTFHNTPERPYFQINELAVFGLSVKNTLF